MGTITAIQWTDHTFNPWWGCTKISPGCQNCYAETLAHRYGTAWGAQGERRQMADSTWKESVKWDRAAAAAGHRARVFCSSMADVFENNVQVAEARLRLWQVVESTPALDWLLLTKRPENITSMVPAAWLQAAPANVWYGTSVENQKTAERRLPHLLGVPAVVRFLSCEPLLEPVSLAAWLHGVQWVITGGESGAKARAADPEWFRSIRTECAAAGVSYFHKQNGGRGKDKGGEALDGHLWRSLPVMAVAL